MLVHAAWWGPEELHGVTQQALEPKVLISWVLAAMLVHAAWWWGQEEPANECEKVKKNLNSLSRIINRSPFLVMFGVLRLGQCLELCPHTSETCTVVHSQPVN